jgi:hypothetical protein
MINQSSLLFVFRFIIGYKKIINNIYTIVKADLLL